MQPDFNRVSYIAYTFMNGAVHDLQVLKSGAGWYIGCANESGPIARDSVEYYPSIYQARAALSACSWTQRRNP